MKKIAIITVVGIILSLPFASAQKPAISTQLADKSSTTKLPAPIEPDMKGYGTRGVSGKTLAAMLDSCRQPSSPLSKVEAARCEQLERTLGTQPDGLVKDLNHAEQ